MGLARSRLQLFLQRFRRDSSDATMVPRLHTSTTMTRSRLALRRPRRSFPVLDATGWGRVSPGAIVAACSVFGVLGAARARSRGAGPADASSGVDGNGVAKAGVEAGSDSTSLGPGCLGSPDASCAPYPEGTVCPGPPTVCVPCGAGAYTLTESFCHCTSGAWDCTPPAWQGTCSVRVQSGSTRIQRAPCRTVAVTPGPRPMHQRAALCSPRTTISLAPSIRIASRSVKSPSARPPHATAVGGSAINKSVMVQHMAAWEQAFASKTPGTACGCGGGQGPCCRSGKCTATCVSSTDSLPACAGAGGGCVLSHGATCGTNGPPDACAYSDEMCCIN